MKQRWTRYVAVVLMAALLLSVTAHARANPTAVNPASPYRATVTGLFHEQPVNLEGAAGQYSVYLPASLEQCAPGVLVIIPSGTTARAFYEGSTGQQWREVADLYGIAVAFAEAGGGGNWNTSLASTGRDEIAFLKQISDNMHDKSRELSAPINLNEREFYLVGYESGGVMAHEFSMAWPALVCGAVSVGGSNVPAEVITRLGDDLSYPFVQAGSMAGREENALPNKNIPVPFWIIESGDYSRNSEQVEQYWVGANSARASTANEYAQRVYENEPARVWVTTDNIAGQITAETIYAKFLSGVSRFVGDPGGRLARTVVHNNNGTTGYFFHEETVDGVLRRWYTYVPTTYRPNQSEVPLVVAIHGYSSSIHAFTGDSRWQDVAEQNGFIVNFVQAYPNSYPSRDNITAPVWRSYAYALSDSATDDIAFIRHVVEKTKRDYDIDRSRIFATGHSNGSAMTWALGLDASDIFTAIAPVGLTSGANRGEQPRSDQEQAVSRLSGTTVDTGYTVPVWTFMGEYDIDDGDLLDGANRNSVAVSSWVEKTGADPATAAWTQDNTGRYITLTYTDGSSAAPLVRFTQVKNSPHAYMPAQASMIWNNFFSKYARTPDGTLYYEGQAVR